jgi:hypothetical protein
MRVTSRPGAHTSTRASMQGSYIGLVAGGQGTAEMGDQLGVAGVAQHYGDDGFVALGVSRASSS